MTLYEKQKKTESFADVVREVNECIIFKHPIDERCYRLCERGVGEYDTPITHQITLKEVFRRLEAAHKREVKRLHDTCDSVEDEIEGVVKDRNALAEKNRECCDENERLRGALETAARWVATHDIYHNMGVEIVKEAEELLGKKVY